MKLDFLEPRRDVIGLIIYLMLGIPRLGPPGVICPLSLYPYRRSRLLAPSRGLAKDCALLRLIISVFFGAKTC